jgi:hypothetical protein
LPSAQTIPQDPAERAVWLIHFITALADHGGVHNQAELTSIFPTGVKIVPRGHVQTMFACQATGQQSLDSRDGFRLDDTWFRSMPGGLAHMSFPAFTINPPGETGAPALTFDTERAPCPDWPIYKDSNILSFENLPAFACITGTALVAAAPSTQQHVVTDGGIAFGYEGKIEPETSTAVEFSGRFGGPCLISATVVRMGGQGYRMMRARHKWNNCLRRSGEAFCKAHPDFQFLYPPDPQTRSLMDAKQQHVLEECGGFEDYYRKEPALGPTPPPVPASGYYLKEAGAGDRTKAQLLEDARTIFEEHGVKPPSWLK